jgi:hypothetical protein
VKTTDKQIVANRANAAHSTGPTTPSGKAIAARNSLKHGLLAQEIVIDAGEGAESRAQFDALLADLMAQFAPEGPLEEMLVEKIAVAYWRLRRAHRYEVGLVRQKLDHAGDEYYRPEPGGFYRDKSHAEVIEAQICEAQESCQAWQDRRDRFLQLHQDGKDLQEIYDCPDNWDLLYERLRRTVPGVANGSPARMRKSLQQAGWTDDRIWQAHVDVCTQRIQEETKVAQEAQRREQDQLLALQVKTKLGCMPDGYDLDRLLKYEGSIERQFYRALSELERLQRMRSGDHVPAPVNIDLAVHTEDTG